MSCAFGGAINWHAHCQETASEKILCDRELWDISDRFSESYGIDLGIFIGLLFVGPVGT
jgi:hypothetical protein